MKKTILFLHDFPDLNTTIQEKCSEYRTILIAHKSKIRTVVPLNTIYDEVYVVDDIYSYPVVEEVVKKISQDHEIFRIITSYEKTIEIAGRLREEFHVSGLSAETSLLVRNKKLMKKALNAQGIQSAQVYELENIDEVIPPFILKPVLGAATNLTYKLNDIRSAREIIYANQQTEFIIEDYIEGEEYHVDTVIQNGKIKVNSVGKYLNNVIDCVNGEKAVGSVIFPPAKLNDPTMKKLLEINNKVIEILDIDNAICHSEYFITKDYSIYFSEIAARIGGGPLIAPCIKNIYDLNLYDILIDLELQNEILVSESKKEKYSGFISFESKSGCIKKISQEEDFSEIEGIFLINIAKKVGDNLFDITNSTIRSGFVCIEDEEHQNVVNKLLQCKEQFVLEVNP